MNQLLGMLLGTGIGWVAAYYGKLPGGAVTGVPMGAVIGAAIAMRFTRSSFQDQTAGVRALIGGFGGALTGLAYGVGMGGLGGGFLYFGVGLASEERLMELAGSDLAETGALGAGIAGAFLGAYTGAIVGASTGCIVGTLLGGRTAPEALEGKSAAPPLGRAPSASMEATTRMKVEDMSATRRMVVQGMGGKPPQSAPRKKS
jgi:hypothetical protein